jgi:hypothetical protein
MMKVAAWASKIGSESAAERRSLVKSCISSRKNG